VVPAVGSARIWRSASARQVQTILARRVGGVDPQGPRSALSVIRPIRIQITPDPAGAQGQAAGPANPVLRCRNQPSAAPRLLHSRPPDRPFAGSPSPANSRAP